MLCRSICGDSSFVRMTKLGLKCNNPLLCQNNKEIQKGFTCKTASIADSRVMYNSFAEIPRSSE
jgi:hypothetical protein